MEVDPRWLRPAEPRHTRGDASKARQLIGWDPQVGFESLVQIMVDADIALLDGLSGDEGSFAEAGRPPAASA